MQNTYGLWIREIVGWALLVIGLIVFRNCFDYLSTRKVIEASVASMIGFFIFRGGMQLLRISIAARALTTATSQESARPG